MDVLNYLAENAGQVVSHDELLKHFWHGSFPSDHAVHKAIAELRSALGDDAHHPSYIRTIPKRGYSLIAKVRLEASGPVVDSKNPNIKITHVSDTKFHVSALLDKRLLAGGAALIIFLAVMLWPSQDRKSVV